MAQTFFKRLTKAFPTLNLELSQAHMIIDPDDFVSQCFVSASYLAVGTILGVSLFLLKANQSLWFALGAGVLVGLFFFFQFIKSPQVKISKQKREIDKEILFIGKFLIVELKAGVPLYTALHNAKDHYASTGPVFRKVLHDVDLGKSMEDAITDSIVWCPSEDYRKIMHQVCNSIKTGSDITLSLQTVLEQISRRQMIEVERYGKKLNPIAMFYLMSSVIFPSLGMVMVVVLASFVNFPLNAWALGSIVVLLVMVQAVFYHVITASRPAVDM
jgi:pilus assembly protein TadC